MMVKCYYCGQQIDGDAYSLHLWNIHDKDIRHLAKHKKRGIIKKIPLLRRKKERDYSKVKDFFKPPRERKILKMDFFRGIIFGALITLAGILIYLVI